jgi:hypothetical protein
MFLSEGFGRSERHTLIKREIQYVVSDRKVVSWDHMIGYYFYSSQSERSSELQTLELSVAEKLDGLERVSRLLDSGDIVIYSVEPYLSAYKISGETASSSRTVAAASDPLSDADASSGRAAGAGTDPFYAGVALDSSSGADQVYHRSVAPPLACGLSALQAGLMDGNLILLWSIVAGGPGQFECFEGSSR